MSYDQIVENNCFAWIATTPALHDEHRSRRASRSRKSVIGTSFLFWRAWREIGRRALTLPQTRARKMTHVKNDERALSQKKFIAS